MIASVCCFAGQMVRYVALPFYLQHGLGQDAFTTGLYMTPWPLTVALAAPLSAASPSACPTAWLCAVGRRLPRAGPGAGRRVAAAARPRCRSSSSRCVSGLGFGFFQTPNNRNMLLSAPRERSGAAGGMQATARLVGQTAGAVVMALLFTLAPSGAAPRIGLGVGAALALAGGLVSTLRIGR